MTSNPSIAEWLLNYGNLAFEIIGTHAFALSGLIEAARKKLDLVLAGPSSRHLRLLAEERSATYCSTDARSFGFKTRAGFG